MWWRRWLWVLLLALAASGAFAQTSVVKELTTVEVDLYFTDQDGTPVLPQTLSFGVLDRLSQRWLYGPIAHNPSANACPGNALGCTTITIPSDANVIVGKCKGFQNRYCITNGDCPQSASQPPTCEAKQEAPQEHVIPLSWTYAAGAATDRLVLNVLNMEFIPFLPTSTPSATATITRTPTITKTPTKTPTS